ncbi:MAG: class I SAM-dependent methyltransferase [Acidobacteriota bacterium]
MKADGPGEGPGDHPAQEHRFSRHEMRWNRANAARYWDFLSGQPGSLHNYFSYQAGPAVLDYLRRRGLPLQGRVLDFGCGIGYFVEQMASRGIRCSGLDFSPASVEAARARVAGWPPCEGIHLAEALPTGLPADSFDLIVSLESIEHLLPGDLEPTLREIGRLLKREGWLVLTTPNEEPLEAAQMMCPECGCLFHRMQHVRSWSARSLTRVMEGLGWKTMHCEALTFHPRGTLLASVRRMLSRLRRRHSWPHLVYVGRSGAVSSSAGPSSPGN